ncbi:hypothetical protein FDG2_3532 [Candidatus Protofrankia californiensis]|uniref:CopG family transcriptional regulator n=1 Tax=Candidatus Protofrankia californiensis TaxID=1839754 RepID=A0A1C3NZV2_9ACTN|nr:hypothetical protein FDG2_3532 [Candidatus Protofrankia californiensis]
MSTHGYPLGEGPSTRLSLSLPQGTADAVREMIGKREFSGFVAEMIEDRIRRELLAEDIRVYQEEHSEFTDDERTWAHEALTGEVTQRHDAA